jgi:hypothetical protein
MMLIRLGADVDIPGPNGVTPLYLAEKKKLESVARLIKATIKGDKVAKPSPAGDVLKVAPEE